MNFSDDELYANINSEMALWNGRELLQVNYSFMQIVSTNGKILEVIIVIGNITCRLALETNFISIPKIDSNFSLELAKT